MIYILSDVHGCYVQYEELLHKINFSDDDKLYVLGDVIDRGPEPIKVLQDIMNRQNATFIVGNHEFTFLRLMSKIEEKIGEDDYEKYLSREDILAYKLWIQGGGLVTADQFRKLSYEEKKEIFKYLSDAPLYEVLKQNGKEYVLVHAGLGGFEEGKCLEEYELWELLEERTDYAKNYYDDENKYLVTGHTPTVFIKGWQKAEVYMGNGHIALDCGCVYGGKLAAYCLETGEVTYVDGR